jgi:hypothetical protein
VNDGRKGIDWIIPVRVDVDTFVGLCGQDKNRDDDTLENLVSIGNEATHHKVTPAYFLTQAEKKLFEDAQWSLAWPAILFSIHARKIGASLAAVPTVKTKSQRSSSSTSSNCPCIVLTGLGYESILDYSEDAGTALDELRNQVEDFPDVYAQHVPMTYGMKTK